MTWAYYNEIDSFAAAWLRELMRRGLIMEGEIDERSVVDVRGDDLRGFVRCHFFAGISGWDLALQQAGWPEDREIWTGSCPCQPLSVAGKQEGHLDGRHLWPAFQRLIAERRPAVVLGEQTSGSLGARWLAGVRFDLEELGYAVGCACLPACAVGAPHRRERLFWVASLGDATHGQPQERQSDDAVGGQRAVLAARIGATSGTSQRDIAAGNGLVADAGGDRLGQHAQRDGGEEQSRERAPRRDDLARRGGRGRFWSDAVWLAGADGKARRVKPGVRLLVDGVPNRVGRLRGFGNAIVPPLAAEFIKAFMEI